MNNWEMERTVLDYINRHTLATDQFMPIENLERAKNTIQRLLTKKTISHWVHHNGLRYWTKRSRRPLSDRALVRAFAALSFCQDTKTRTMLTSDDIHRYFPQLARPGMPTGYYVDQSAISPCLGHLRVDVMSRISRIVSTTLRIIDKHRAQLGFRDLIDQDRFELTWIVATDSKQRRLTAALQTVAASGVRPHVRAIPELLNVIAPLSPS